MDDDELALLPEITLQELGKHKGLEQGDKIYMAVDRRVFDISLGRDFYGPEGRYHLFAGRDCTRALALASFEEKHLVGDKTGLSIPQEMALDDWLDKLESKYPIVAQLVVATTTSVVVTEQKL